MNNSMKLEGPIEIKDNSAERVAYELMIDIANAENPAYDQLNTDKQNNPRLYYLSLYAECLTVATGGLVPKSVSSPK